MDQLLHDGELQLLYAGILGTLAFARVITWVLQRRRIAVDYVEDVVLRIRGWCLIVTMFILFSIGGTTGLIVMFAIVSFLALREFITVGATRADHKALLWVFFVFTPLQYVLVALGLFDAMTTVIPLLGFIVIAARQAMVGDAEGYLERTAIVHWSLLACTYCVSYMPALLVLDVPGRTGDVKLLVVLVLLAQVGDVVRMHVARLARGPRVAPFTPDLTWRGSAVSAVLVPALGAALWWATPFSPAQMAAVTLVITALGAVGSLVLAAVKRDRGITDYGMVVAGHGGMLDRIACLLFSAPVFFHIVRLGFI